MLPMGPTAESFSAASAPGTACCRWVQPQGSFLQDFSFSADSLTMSIQSPCAVTCVKMWGHITNPLHWQLYHLFGPSEVQHIHQVIPPETECGYPSARVFENGHIRSLPPQKQVYYCRMECMFCVCLIEYILGLSKAPCVHTHTCREIRKQNTDLNQ